METYINPNLDFYPMQKDKNYHITLVLIAAIVLVWSGINPHDYLTWALEVIPAIIGFIVMAATYKKFRLSNLTYTLITIFAIIMMVGGHYTYAEVPFFNWVRDAGFGHRNNYDKIGHFVQGVTPAILARELLIRKSPLKRGKWLFFIVVCIALAISASYELVEWMVSEFTGSAGDAFLGTQGYVWDTQTDMAMALIGSIAAQLFLNKYHDKSMDSVNVD